MKLCVYDLLALSAPVSKWNEPAGCEGMFGEAPMDGNGASHGSRNYLLGAVKSVNLACLSRRNPF